MDPAQGFSAQSASAGVILTASALGYPLSTTHVISGAVMGAGAAKRVSAVRWGVAGDIVRAWLLTLPAAGLLSAAVYGIESLFGSGSTGALVIALALLVVIGVLFAKRLQEPAATPSAT
jgi:PiT family inorganic phosphate transporter